MTAKTTTTTKKKTKVRTAEQLAAEKTYELELEQHVRSLVQSALRMQAIGGTYTFHASSVERDKRRQLGKVSTLLARQLIEDGGGTSACGFLYRVTSKAMNHVAPPLTSDELDAAMLKALDTQMQPLMKDYEAFRKTWRSLPAVGLTSLPLSAQRTILMYPSLVTTAVVRFESYGPGAFMPFKLGSELPAESRSYAWRYNVDSIYVSRPAVGEKWREYVKTALHEYVSTSPEMTPVVLGQMLGMTRERVTETLNSARCRRDVFSDRKSFFDKKKPSEWTDVLREEITYAEERIVSLHASMAAAKGLLDVLESEHIETNFLESVEQVVENNVKFIP